MTNEELLAKVANLETYVNVLLTQVVPPLQEQIHMLTSRVDSMDIMYEEWLTRESRPAAKRTSKGRQPITYANWERVMELLNAGKNYSDIANETGIPNTTVRKYTKMEQSEVDTLKAAQVE